ncbi:thioredoxin family protein [Bacteroidota bacterium]
MSKSIKILGTGCTKCKNLVSITQEVVQENSINATIEKVEDIEQIMEYNVLSTPALVIDNVVCINGRIPSKEEILSFLN